MRWPTPEWVEPRVGDRRGVIRFAWTPVSLADGTTVWLGRFRSVERYDEWADLCGGSFFGWQRVGAYPVDPCPVGARGR